MLRLESLSCGYGPMQAVQDLDLFVSPGKITALLGANGAGKSSTLMCIAGHVAMHAGRILYHEEDISHQTPMQRVTAGIGLVPEGRRLFAGLSVRENLVIGGYCRDKSLTATNIQKVLTTFPRLAERLDQQAGSLSGGEQQMLAIGRALMSQPKLLLIDELSLGLMPTVIDICYAAIEEFKSRGMAILLVEQSTQRALEVADEVSVLESGREVWKGKAGEALNSADMIDTYLGLRPSHNRQDSE
jgi:branched-chain amino acid transport system ATP-binding protein